MPQERKIYTSFHDIPPREYMYFPKGTLETGKPGKFSSIELKQLVISMSVLTIAFAFALSNNNLIEGLGRGFNIDFFLKGLLYSALGIVTAFFFHEMSHKFMPQKYGLWAEYRMFPRGLLLALLLSILTPFVFAAPGAVMFMGGSRSHETGHIAIAGPMANIVISLITFPLYIYLFETQIGQILGLICFINAFLAFFNLLPFGPLDGMKIIRWNATAWILTLIIALVLLMQIMSRFSFNYLFS